MQNQRYLSLSLSLFRRSKIIFIKIQIKFDEINGHTDIKKF